MGNGSPSITGRVEGNRVSRVNAVGPEGAHKNLLANRKTDIASVLE
jgi:hypothetical protein